MFSTSATTHLPSTASYSSSYEDRRNHNSVTTTTTRYPRSNHSSSSSSSYISSGAGSFTNHPSPSSSSSVTSTSSSVRTPPDLLLNGGTISKSAIKGGSTFYPIKQSTSASFNSSSRNQERQRTSSFSTKEPNYMSIKEIESRLRILSRVSNLPIVSSELPSPPSSIEADVRKGKQNFTTVRSTSPRMEMKRKAMENSIESPEAQRPRRMSRSTNDSSFSNSFSPSSLSSIEPLSLPHVREWNREQYIETAEAYRHLGRQLKHRGDRRLRESSTQLTSPLNETMIAGFEQTDALLLYVYGFWCEDQGRGTCITENWNSLFGLLKYVYLRHEKNKLTALAGLCRLIEASVLRHSAGHEMRMLNHRLGKASSSIDPTSKSEMMELSALMTKVVGDQERSNRLFAQAKQSVLNMSILQKSYPDLAKFCESSMISQSWNLSDQQSLSTRLDPSFSMTSSSLPASNTNGWSWPLDVSSPFPMLVCFGRAVLREVAKEVRIPFETESIVTQESTMQS